MNSVIQGDGDYEQSNSPQHHQQVARYTSIHNMSDKLKTGSMEVDKLVVTGNSVNDREESKEKSHSLEYTGIA